MKKKKKLLQKKNKVPFQDYNDNKKQVFYCVTVN